MAKPFKVIDAPLNLVEQELNAHAEEYALHLFIPRTHEGEDRVLLVLVKKAPASAQGVMIDPRKIFGGRN